MDLMYFGLQGGRRKALVVLGAGATRGSSFASQSTAVLPPLDLDFFQQVSRLEPSDRTRRLLRFVREEFGTEVGLSMEEFFSQVDYTDRFHRELNIDPGPNVKRYEQALSDFMAVLPRLLHESIDGYSCSHHGELARALRASDCVLTFNYDCVMDRALQSNCGLRWDPDRDSYGFPITGGGKAWKSTGRGRPPKTPIRLLKMHGSMNWRVSRAGNVSLFRDLSTVRSLAGAIIPPTWFKDLQREPYASVWKAARREIRSSRIMVVVGYSVPQTDLFSRSLFAVEVGSKLKREKLDLVVLVNPDKTSRRRFLDLIRGGLERDTIVREYDYLRDLAGVLAPHNTRMHNTRRRAAR